VFLSVFVGGLTKLLVLVGEFKGYRVGHDWCRGSIGRFVLASLLFYQELGVYGVKAMILHCALDRIESLLREGFSCDEVL